jgi:pimeloyl-ACP methyl ester carboxylesterase
LGLVPPNSVVPVIVVPGIMGTNLRAKRKPRLSRKEDERNEVAEPGQPVWRPPNGKLEGVRAAYIWDKYSPEERQKRLHAPTLEVDDGGAIVFPDTQDEYVLTADQVRRRGWGEVHADSYGALLYALQVRLNQTFGFDDDKQTRFVNQHWREVMTCDPRRWGVREFAPLTETQLEKHARHYFEVYAVGYNWLEDCEKSSHRLEQRILEIIDFWRKKNRRCEQVIIITHSMGGLVSRACAKRIPDKIACVIHGVMPALGAPVAYRRMACGTEDSSPSNGILENVVASKIATILGNTTEKTTPVLAHSPGALELLPNHLYPGPWLHVRVKYESSLTLTDSEAKGVTISKREDAHDYLHLPSGRVANPYDLYRDMMSWYRLIDLALADPAQRYQNEPGGVEQAIKFAITAAENFHKSLGDYYHPDTYAFYGDDPDKLAFGQVRWVARLGIGSGAVLTSANVAAAQYRRHTREGCRIVLVDGKTELSFEAEQQDARGDGTVPFQSGSGPVGKVKQVFATRGYDHQGSFNNNNMLMLTLRLIVMATQRIPS